VAFAERRLDIAFQPIVRCVDGGLTGVEALLRWNDPVRGAVPPERMIEAAEQSDLIDDIGAWVLERSCEIRGRWLRDHPGTPLDVAVNVSARQLMGSEFCLTVANVLERTHMDPQALVLEVTENMLIEDSGRAVAILGELKRMGVRIALDDFGTGFSSLSYLHRLPVDMVKIDRGFVLDIGVARTGGVVSAAVTNLAHVFGLTVTAEGVETQAQRDEIVSIGCENAQGYFYGRPMPADAIARTLATAPA